MVNLSNNPDIDGILWGWKWGVTDLTYSFPASSTEYTNAGYTSVTGFTTFTAAQRIAAISILEGGSNGNSGNSIESFTNLTFTFQTLPSASLRFADATNVDYTNDSTVATHMGNHTLGNSGTAEANPPESTFGGTAPFSPGYAQGDAWFTAGAYNNPTLGSFQYTAGIMHEIGHNLGLKHGQTPQTKHGVTFPALPTNHDSQEYSVMTYNQYVGDTSAASNIPEAPTTYMQDDIAALQYMYGANYGASAHNTNTVYQWSQTTGEEFINGVGQGAPQGIIGTSGNFPNPTTSTPTSNWILMTVWDGGGDNDFYNFSNFTTNLTVNLNPGAWTITDPAQLADLGNDLAGGPEQFAHGNIANALIDPNNPNETASLIENAIGGSGNDTMTGNAVANSLNGMNGNDTLDGGGGHDTLVGGAGDDHYYLNDVWVFNNGTSIGLFYDDVIEDPNAGTDWVHVLAINTFNNLYTLTDNVENGQITGTIDFDLTGNALDNVLAGNSGKNVLNGAGGTDTVDYTSAASGVTVSLASGTATGGGGSDTLISIENVIGSRFADSITGDAGPNVLNGSDGLDTLAGGGGDDRYLLNDAFDFAGGQLVRFGFDSIQENLNAGTDTVVVSEQFGQDGNFAQYHLSNYTLPANVENGTVADFSIFNQNGFSINFALTFFQLTGNALDNVLTGNIVGSGLYGLGGNDTLIGGVGADVLDGGTGLDTLTGGPGNDTFLFEHSGDGAKTITDFTPGQDVFQLSAGGFGLSAGSLAHAGVTLVLGPAATGPGPTLTYDISGNISWDPDGTGAQPPVLLANAGAAYASSSLGGNTDWQVAATGDFNHDGTGDIIWRSNSSGQDLLWLMNNGQMTQTINLGGNTDWSPVATGDFNHDGTSDIVWRSASSGQDLLWTMGTNGQPTSTISLGGNLDWKPVATGDFNHDGTTDIIWRSNSSGQDLLWLMKNGQMTQTINLGGNTDWQVAATGDFNHDGTADIIWRSNSSGQDLLWTMGTNGQPTSTTNIGGNLDWRPAATGDFNHDGTTDIVWRSNSSGADLLWTMANGQPTYTQYIGGDLNWSPGATGDFNHNGADDIVWRSAGNGADLLWSMGFPHPAIMADNFTVA